MKLHGSLLNLDPGTAFISWRRFQTQSPNNQLLNRFCRVVKQWSAKSERRKGDWENNFRPTWNMTEKYLSHSSQNEA